MLALRVLSAAGWLALFHVGCDVAGLFVGMNGWLVLGVRALAGTALFVVVAQKIALAQFTIDRAVATSAAGAAVSASTPPPSPPDEDGWSRVVGQDTPPRP